MSVITSSVMTDDKTRSSTIGRVATAAEVDAAAANATASGYGVRQDGADRLLTDPWEITVRIAAQKADATNKGDL